MIREIDKTPFRVCIRKGNVLVATINVESGNGFVDTNGFKNISSTLNLVNGKNDIILEV